MTLAESVQRDQVCHLEPHVALRVRPEAGVDHAVRLMQEARAGCVLVCDGSTLVGIFTERDLLRRVLGPGRGLQRPIREFMTPDPVTIAMTDSVGTAIRRMRQGGYRNLPVVADSGEPTGVLSVRRIIHYLVQHFPSAVYNLPPDPNHTQKCREGA